MCFTCALVFLISQKKPKISFPLAIKSHFYTKLQDVFDFEVNNFISTFFSLFLCTLCSPKSNTFSRCPWHKQICVSVCLRKCVFRQWSKCCLRPKPDLRNWITSESLKQKKPKVLVLSVKRMQRCAWNVRPAATSSYSLGAPRLASARLFSSALAFCRAPGSHFACSSAAAGSLKRQRFASPKLTEKALNWASPDSSGCKLQ